MPHVLTVFVSMLLFFTITIGHMHVEGRLLQDHYPAYFLLALVFVSFSLILLKFNYDKQVGRIRLESLEKEIREKSSYYEEIALKEREIKRIKHDLNNRLLSILAAGSDLEKEVSGIIEDLNRDKALYSSNPVINFILSSKLKRISIPDENIYIDISLDDRLDISPGDLGLILGNALENAIEALAFLAYEDRYLKIRINQIFEVLHIGLENSYDKSQVKKGKDRGFGLESIKQACETYRGFIEIDSSKYFKIDIFLILNNP